MSEAEGVTVAGPGTEPTLRELTPGAPGAAEILPAVLGLLEEAELPVAGLPDQLSRLVVAEAGGVVVGVAGLEVHGRDGVLRSVAVGAGRRGDGLGSRLTRRVLERARSDGLRRVYLLTTTAEGFFPRHGFRRIDRSEASPEVRGSVEFAEACPASAVAMVLDFEESGDPT